MNNKTRMQNFLISESIVLVIVFVVTVFTLISGIIIEKYDYSWIKETFILAIGIFIGLSVVFNVQNE